MSRLIYVYGDDAKLLDTLLAALRADGYSLEYTDLAEEAISGVVAADIALICRPAGVARVAANDSRLCFGMLVLDLNTRTVTAESPEEVRELYLTRNEFALLRYLIENAVRAVPRGELLPRIWGLEKNDSPTRAADDTVKRLRKKLADTDVWIETVWGFGFRILKRE